MNVEYRDFEEQDFSALRDMMYCLYEEDPEGQALDDAKIEKTIRENAAHPEKIRICMIFADGIIAGYCIVCFAWSNEYGGDILIIDELYIKKEYRNDRLASEFIMHQMRAYTNVAAIAVEATPSNEAAVRLYKRLGFEASPNDHLVLSLS